MGKKPKEEEKIIITPAVLSEKPKEEPEPEPEDGPKARDKVRDEFAEREKKTKEEEKIIITPAVLPEKPKEEPEAEPEEPPKSKDKVRDEFAEREKKEKEVEKIIIKPSVEIKMAAAPEPVISRRKKKEPEPEEAGSLFDDLPQVKPKVKDEFTEGKRRNQSQKKQVRCSTIYLRSNQRLKMSLLKEKEGTRARRSRFVVRRFTSGQTKG